MSDVNKRFDWDILLEEEPEKPPIKRELPPPVTMSEEYAEEKTADKTVLDNFEDDIGDTTMQDEEQSPTETVVIPPQNTIEKSATVEPGPPQKAAKTVANRSSETRVSNSPKDVLSGHLTPRGVLNAFILAELIGKPRGMRHYRRRYK